VFLSRRSHPRPSARVSAMPPTALADLSSSWAPHTVGGRLFSSIEQPEGPEEAHVQLVKTERSVFYGHVADLH